MYAVYNNKKKKLILLRRELSFDLKPPADGSVDPGTVSASISLARLLFFHPAALKVE